MWEVIFLWAPLVDIKLGRRTWLAIAIFATAVSVCTYFPLIGATHVNLMTALILLRWRGRFAHLGSMLRTQGHSLRPAKPGRPPGGRQDFNRLFPVPRIVASSICLCQQADQTLSLPQGSMISCPVGT